MERKNNKEPLASQMKKHANTSKKKEEDYEEELQGNFEITVSTGSTLLDLNISGGRKRGGGIPGGVFMEIFGPNSCGKSVLLSEIAGDVQRKGGDVRFDDPEACLSPQFAKIFGLDVSKMKYDTPDTVTQVFQSIRDWEPKKTGKLNGSFTDSLAALSTELEMEKDEGDKRGQRRAREFSEGFRKNARILKQKNYLMVGSNQVRDNQEKANKFSPQFTSTGGFAIGFYASIRLRGTNPEKIFKEITFNGEKIKQAIGVETEFEVFKNKVWTPFRKASLYILWDYGIDDIRSNLKYIKTYKKQTQFCLNGNVLDKSLDTAISLIEEDSSLIDELKEETTDLWEEIESKFVSERKPKR